MQIYTSVTVLAFALMAVGGAFIAVQNYLQWRQYGGRFSLIWSIAGLCAVVAVAWIVVTRYFLPENLDSNWVDLFALSRRVVIVALLAFYMTIGYWEYVWKK